MLPALFSFTFRNKAHFPFFLFIVIARNLIQLFFGLEALKVRANKNACGMTSFSGFIPLEVGTHVNV